MTTKILIGVASVALIAVIIGAVVVLQGNGDKAASTTASPAAQATELKSTDIVVGTGAEAQLGSKISVKYTGKLTDGTVFDSTDKHGGQPATFTLAKGALIDGWVQGIPGMKVGGKRNLVVPSSLGYGDKVNGSIPANSTLNFDIELVGVE